MDAFQFDSPDFMEMIKSQAEEILKKSQNLISQNPKVELLKNRFLAELWRERYNKNRLFSLIIKEDLIDLINFGEVQKEWIPSLLKEIRLKNKIEINEFLNIQSSERLEVGRTQETKRYYKSLSTQGYVVFFFGQEGIDTIAHGECIEETNLFYSSKDIETYFRKKDISEIHEVFEEYKKKYLSRQFNYMYFFADNGMLNKVNQSFVERNILKNKPEKYMRDHLLSYLNDHMQHSFFIEIELSASKKELDIHTEINGEFYFFEIKWLGVSIDDEGTKLTSPYSTSRAKDGVKQTLDYIKELVEVMDINVCCGYLVIFDARDKKEEIEFGDYNFLNLDRAKYLKYFDVMPYIEIDKRHCA